MYVCVCVCVCVSENVYDRMTGSATGGREGCGFRPRRPTKSETHTHIRERKTWIRGSVGVWICGCGICGYEDMWSRQQLRAYEYVDGISAWLYGRIDGVATADRMRIADGALAMWRGTITRSVLVRCIYYLVWSRSAPLPSL